MKKLIAFLTILFVSVLCTACINNLAVQELNNKAKEYLEAGDVQSAICRLKSSIDLDATIYETHYNLTIAYVKNREFKNAKEEIEIAMQLKPESPDNYYTLGIINEGLADEVLAVDEDENAAPTAATAVAEPDKKQIELAISYLNEAVNAYEKYLSKAPTASDKEQVAHQIESLKRRISELNGETQGEAQ